MKTTNLKKGSILSESSFFTVKEVRSSDVVVVDDHGTELTIGNRYVEKVLNSADFFEKEEKKTMSELADLFINSPRIAMTVAFYKKDTAKAKKAYEAEKAEAIKKVQDASLSNAAKLLEELIDNPISKIIPGELRVMKGRHYGFVDDLGRVHFIDMEQIKDASKADYDSRKREVDPRTIQYLIIAGVKHSLK